MLAFEGLVKFPAAVAADNEEELVKFAVENTVFIREDEFAYGGYLRGTKILWGPLFFFFPSWFLLYGIKEDLHVNLLGSFRKG